MRAEHYAVAIVLATSCVADAPGGAESGGETAASSSGATTGGPAATTMPSSSSGPVTSSTSDDSGPATEGPASSSSDDTTAPPVDEPRVFAVIGDYGDDFVTNIGLGAEDRVATLVATWNPDFVATVGDNNYPDGLAGTIDANVGKYYAAFIGDYVGQYGPGSDENRFFPTLGNHDWESGNVDAYVDYFTLPGNERYYDVDKGLVHLFMVDSESEEPDGAEADSVQGVWLQQALAKSDACFKLVFFHRPGYASGESGSEVRMQWPFAEWGADAVLAGHDHAYERLTIDGIPYFINGLGGSLRYQLEALLPESEIYYNEDWGAQLVTVTPTDITFDFQTVSAQIIDSWTIEKDCS
jgi:tartrate-resistant acid phosphatase type 5